MICQRSVGATSPASALGDACPDCGHTLALHPGVLNPVLASCQVCDAADAIAELRAARDKLATRMDQLATWRTNAAGRLQALEDRVSALELAR